MVERGPAGRSLRIAATPLDATGRAALVLLQDLTELRRLETARRDFLANLSHELRTPLASLQVLVDTLQDGALDDPEAARHFLNRMQVELDGLTQLVREVLELSRIESGQVALHREPVDLAGLVAERAERLRPQAGRAGLALILDLPAGLPPLLADRERLAQVVTNLVHNAIKFTPAGGIVNVRAWTQTAARPPVELLDEQAAVGGLPSAVVVEVADTGVGIPADVLPRIFERFYKADRARSGGGTGLGLAIAKHIVQAHGGRIWAESIEGQGATFYFTVPITPPT